MLCSAHGLKRLRKLALLIFGLFGEVFQHFNDFVFQRVKKPSLHHQIDFGILRVLSVNANTKTAACLAAAARLFFRLATFIRPSD
jgi:hypothetical protein